MSALDALARPAEILLWLYVALVCVGIVAVPFVVWWAVRQRRKSVEDLERRRATLRGKARSQ